MDFLDDPEEMTPEERLREIAAILAVGYLRLRSRDPVLAPTSADKRLDVPGQPSRSLADGLTAGELARSSHLCEVESQDN